MNDCMLLKKGESMEKENYQFEYYAGSNFYFTNFVIVSLRTKPKNPLLIPKSKDALLCYRLKVLGFTFKLMIHLTYSLHMI